MSQGFFVVDYLTLWTFFDALEEIVSVIRLHISPEKAYVRTIDKGHIAYIEASINGFTESDLDPIVFCMVISGPRAYLKAMVDHGIITDVHSPVKFSWITKGDIVKITIDAVFTKMPISFESIDTASVRKDPNTITLSKPKIEFSCHSVRLCQAIDMIAHFDQTCQFETKKTGEIVVCGGSSGSSGYITPVLADQYKGEEGLSKYGLEYLRGVTKALNNGWAGIHTIQFSTDQPLILINDSAAPGLKIKYVIAPRIECD